MLETPTFFSRRVRRLRLTLPPWFLDRTFFQRFIQSRWCWTLGENSIPPTLNFLQFFSARNMN